MKRKLNAINDLISETSNRLKKYETLPKISLTYRSRAAGHLIYYNQTTHDGKKKLDRLGGPDDVIVIACKRKKYLKRLLATLETDKKAIEQFLDKYKDHSFEAIYEGLPASYKDLPARYVDDSRESKPSRVLSPVEEYEGLGYSKLPAPLGNLPDSITNDPRFKELSAWAHKPYKRNPAKLPDDPNVARDGTPMRSKGECMWWDNILFEGLPCRVEPEITIKGKSGQWHRFYPDFVFKCFDGSYIYVEHFGEWDDDEYAERNKRKIQEYLDCGIVLSDNLIGTSDNANHRTNELMIIEELEKIKRRMFT